MSADQYIVQQRADVPERQRCQVLRVAPSAYCKHLAERTAPAGSPAELSPAVAQEVSGIAAIIDQFVAATLKRVWFGRRETPYFCHVSVFVALWLKNIR